MHNVQLCVSLLLQNKNKTTNNFATIKKKIKTERRHNRTRQPFPPIEHQQQQQQQQGFEKRISLIKKMSVALSYFGLTHFFFSPCISLLLFNFTFFFFCLN